MEASYAAYDHLASIARIDEILAGADASYDSHNGIPARTSLTFDNGYYVDVTVLFIDIRGSKELAEKHTRPVLAKLYRAYISEVISVLRSNTTIHEIYVEGDGIWAVFNTTTTVNVNEVFGTAAELSSLIDTLNIKLAKKGYSTLKVGIGLEDGDTLYIKAGAKGSGINEVVWVGKIVGSSAQLCSYGNKTWGDGEIMVSKRIYEMLNEKNKGFMQYNVLRDCYQGNVVNSAMNEWVKKNA
jgi:class 3 adenylate cyclase